MAQVITELVGHRLALGFQMVVVKNTATSSTSSSTSANQVSVSGNSSVGSGNMSNSANANPHSTGASIPVAVNSNSSGAANATSTTSILSTTPTNAGHDSFLSLNSFSMINNILSDRVRVPVSSIKGYYVLCLGRIYHELFYIVDDKSDYVEVLIYKPKSKEKSSKGSVNASANEKENEYKYRFQVSINDIAQTHFSFRDV